MLETPNTYQPRLIDTVLANTLNSIAAVSIEGPKWCGKTWTGMKHANSAVWVADPSSDYLTRRTAVSDPLHTIDQARPVLIDEWQDAPGLWDAVRMSVDRQPGPGQFLLTGSATPPETSHSHSGTGRIARIRMRPMSLAESGASSKEVSLAALLRGENPATARGKLDLGALIELVTRGGWPATLTLPFTEAAALPHDYIQAVAYSDATRIDGVRRDPTRITALIASLSRNTATLVSNTTALKDMAAVDGAGISPKTIAEYIDVLRRLYVLDEIPAWAPDLRSPIALRVRPKRMLCDPSLAVAGMRASSNLLADDRKTLGLVFENLCLRDLAVYATALGGTLSYYHDNDNVEVDAVIQTEHGDWAGIEVKLRSEHEDMAASPLITMRNKIVGAGGRPPAALIVVTGLDSFAHRRDDGVIVTPIDCLTA